MARDPVCGMPIDEEKAEFKAELRGRTYYFCSAYSGIHQESFK